jgi:HEAT repeat protein
MGAGEAAALAAEVVAVLTGDRTWEREGELERLRSLRDAAALLDPLIDALRDANVPERRNGARSALAALGSPGAPAAPGVLTRLSALMEGDDDVDVRVLAATALGESRNPAARLALEQALRSSDLNLAAAAADALSVLGHPDSVAALSEAAERGNLWVRVAAVVTLGNLGDRRAVPVLTRVLHEPVLAEAAVTALGHIADPGALEALRPLAEESGPGRAQAQRAARQILASAPQVDPPEWLRRSLHGSEADLATALERDGDEAAAHLLGIAGTEEAAERLVDALSSPYMDVAAAALAVLPGPVARAVLVPRLHSVPRRARAAVLAALPPLRTTAEVEAVARLLGGSDEEILAAAIEALGRSEQSVVLPRVLRALENPESRYGAVRVLGLVGDERCDPLAALLDDEDVRVRSAAAEGLMRCATPQVRERISRSLRNEPDASVRRALVGALGAAGGPDAVRELEPLLAHPDAVMRFTALRALGRTATPEALPPLLRALSAEEPEFRAAALQSLGALGDPRGAASVAEHLQVKDRDLRLAAAFALRDLATPQVAQSLLRALDDPMWSVRLAAVRAIASLDLPKFRARLLRVGSEDPDPLVRDAARDAVAPADQNRSGGGLR